jgi:1-acyl-sn-glycerol-3-phosphate acyltransferase
MTVLRSSVFFLWFALTSTVMSLLAFPALVLDRRVIVFVSHSWSRVTLFGLKHIAGLDYEIRGPIPPNGAVVASKHMSMWDTIALYLLLGQPFPVVKQELLQIPFYGWFVAKAGAIVVDRKAGAKALRGMLDDARAAMAGGHSILIFPEGHRMAPGAPPDYKPGVAALYTQLGVPCVPVALNSGLFWTGPMGFIKKPGRVVIQFLEPIPPGLKSRAFLDLLESRIETASAALLAEGRLLLSRNADPVSATAAERPGSSS